MSHVFTSNLQLIGINQNKSVWIVTIFSEICGFYLFFLRCRSADLLIHSPWSVRNTLKFVIAKCWYVKSSSRCECFCKELYILLQIACHYYSDTFQACNYNTLHFIFESKISILSILHLWSATPTASSPLTPFWLITTFYSTWAKTSNSTVTKGQPGEKCWWRQ